MRAKPLITCGLLAGVLALPVPALALGLGRLSVQSSLGQPLSARIELTSVQRDELDSLAAKIAEPSVYRDNNVQYSGALTRARVTVEQGPDRVPYLRVSTVQVLNEPYLDLLVEVNWATGRLVRNYTFLLDPPGMRETQAVEPIAPVRGEAAPARGGRATARGVEAPGAVARGGYTVKRGDTLSKIARQYRPENVSLEQMLVALFRTNENVFDGKNMNRLRRGQILTIPPSDQITSVAQPEAVKVVKVQAADWRAYRDGVAAAAPASEVAASRQSASGTIGTAVEEKGVAAQAGKDRLKVSREAAVAKGGPTEVSKAEDAAVRENALREAKSRVAELEKTLQDMQKAAALRNQTMAELQAKAEAGKTPPGAAPKTEAAKAEAAKVALAPTTTAPPPAVTAPPAPATETPKTELPKAEAPKAETPVTPAPAPAAEVPKSGSPQAEVGQGSPSKASAPAPKLEPSFFDDLFASTPTWVIGGGALAVLAGIAAIIAARRSRTKFEDSIISGTDIKTNTVFGSTGGGVVNTGDNSLASDFSREGLGNIDTDEVDPIAEAEVYLAYGRDAQAEEILKDALKKDPQRQEIYLKLLEIHAQHNKPSAFETVASEFYSVSGGKGETWQRAMALGRQLDPDNPMFTEAGSAAAFAAGAAAIAPTQAAETPLTAEEAQVFSVPPELKPEVAAEQSLDFRLDEDISLSPTSGATPSPKSPAQILAGAAEEVAKSTRPVTEPVSAAGPVAGTAAAAVAGAAALAMSRGDIVARSLDEKVPFEPESMPKFDLAFNLDEPAKFAAPAAAPPAPAPESAFAPAAGVPAPQLARPAAAIELDKLDLAFDPQRSTFEDPTPSVLDGQWHDAATKLDLAKAYQEMGDVEGAREILQEVLHEGDDQQKAEAQGLLSKLA